jgi:hypothetical protein
MSKIREKLSIKKWIISIIQNYFNEEMVCCEVCKCLVKREDSYCGKAEAVRKEIEGYWSIFHFIHTEEKDFIVRIPYYCKTHRPELKDTVQIRHPKKFTTKKK